MFGRNKTKNVFESITYDRFEEAKELLISGTDPNLLDEYGQTPLFRIVYNASPFQLDFFQLFVSFGADVNLPKPDGTTPVFYAKGAILKKLIDNGAVLTVKDNSGGSPLHNASEIEDVELFLKSGLDINEKNNSLSTPLHGYVYSSSSLVKFALDNKAEVNAVNKNGWTPLICLARTEYVTEKNELQEILTTAQFLLDFGADKNVKDNLNKTAYDHAISVNNNLFAERLLKHS